MIFDTINNLNKYININVGFKTVLDFINNNDLHSLPLGKFTIDNNVWYNNQEYIGKEETNKYESHIKYIDIQLLLDGEEYIDYSKDKAIVNEINEKDCYFQESVDKTRLRLSKNYFAIFFPGELHKPGIKINSNKIKKIVFKVLN